MLKLDLLEFELKLDFPAWRHYLGCQCDVIDVKSFHTCFKIWLRLWDTFWWKIVGVQLNSLLNIDFIVDILNIFLRILQTNDKPTIILKNTTMTDPSAHESLILYIHDWKKAIQNSEESIQHCYLTYREICRAFRKLYAGTKNVFLLCSCLQK